MRNIIIVITLFFALSNYAQNSNELNPVQKKLYTLYNIQVRPEFPEGEKKFEEYIMSNFKDSNIQNGIQINATFVVEMDGTISNVEITTKDQFGIGIKLKKILESSPKWLEGQHDGYRVRTIVNHTFNF